MHLLLLNSCKTSINIRNMKFFKFLIAPLLMSGVLILTSAKDAGKETERIQNSTAVFKTFTGMSGKIPQELLKKTEGFVIIPKMINAGLVAGAKRGKGVAVVKLADGSWSNPVFITLTGGSFGLQIGVQSVDLVLVFKNRGVLTKVKDGDFTIGGDISAAAGPVGRSSTASTDHKLEAEVYSYSRSKGLFAGVTVNGANLGIDKSSNFNFYGTGTTSQQIFETSKSTSAAVNALKAALKGI
jgi:SH3 domain-containing YSC84-like protein 1